MAGDFSPLTIDVTAGNRRVAPPSLLVAMAVGLGSMDMPVPSVTAWEWLNWKFPRAVHAGETIYARWTLTQKRAPVGGSPTAIVVWRVDVHSADGALCAEGEVGASVLRNVRATQARATEPAAKAPVAEPAAAAASGAAAPRRGRRRRRTPAGDAPQAKAAAPVEAPAQAAPKATPPAGAERSSTAPRRRRRRRSPGSAAARNGDAPGPAAQTEAPSAAPVVAAAAAPPHAAAPASRPEPTSPARGEGANPLTRAIRRLRL
ncbi:MAG TPA: hypothetical protein VIO34_11515 [Candidatus Dormibacteraeota bacterium]